MSSPFSELFRWLQTTEFYVDLPFWGYFALIVLVYRVVPSTSRWREVLLLACNVCMLLALPRFSAIMLGALLALCGITYGCACLLLRGDKTKKSTGRKVVAAAGIVVILFLLAFFKYGFVQNTILRRGDGSTVEQMIFLIGISYSSFKAMHFVIEAYKHTLTQIRFLSFLNYMLFFPSFVSGPINRYQHFCENSPVTQKSSFRADFAAGIERIIHGLFKKTVLTMVLFPYTLTNLGALQDLAAWQILLGLYVYALYFYFDFSGYTDLAIGSARLLGFGLPENFDLPFLKKNIQQLWANWHISLTSWLTDYVYWPIARKLREREFLRQHPVLLSNIAILVTFVACGIWHGNTLTFLLWGLYHGVGISIVNTYQNWKRKVRHPAARKYFASPYSRALGVVATFNFFSVGLLPFVLNSEQFRLLMGRFF